jgi:hypothetical protein
MKKIILLLVISTYSYAGWFGFGDDDKIPQEQKQATQNKNSLQDQLNELLRYNGKSCQSPKSNVRVIDADYSSSSYSNEGTEYTTVHRLDGGSYYTTKNTVGNSTEYSGYYKVTIQNDGEDTVSANIDFSSTHKTCVGFLAALSGGCRGGTSNTSWSVEVPPGKHTFDKYYELNDDWFVAGDAKATISVGNTDDDINYKNSTTLRDYSDYLKRSGCHYHLYYAQNKIRDLFSKQEFEKAINLSTPQKRINALKKYQELFDTSEVKQAIHFNERIIYLTNKTKNYKDIYWEQGNPLLNTFKSNLDINEVTDLPLVLAVDNYVKKSQKQATIIPPFTEQALPIEPQKQNFGVEPQVVDYPTEPTLTKGEFETTKVFEKRKTKALNNWIAQKAKIDSDYKTAYDNYLKQQDKDYQQALAKYQQDKKQIIAKNKQDKKAHEQQQQKANQDATNNKQKYYWQAALSAIGNKDLNFTKLDYNADSEEFSYQLIGGIFNMSWQGKIKVPLAKAKAFKQAMQSAKRRIHFKIGDTLSITGFGIDNQDFNYKTIENTQPMFADVKIISRLEEVKKDIEIAISKGDIKLVNKIISDFNLILPNAINEAEEIEYSKQVDTIYMRKQSANCLKQGLKVDHYRKCGNNGVAIDTNTNLMWMRCSIGQTWNGNTCTGKTKKHRWSNAKQLIIDFAGYADWRLPTAKELRTLVYCSNGYYSKNGSGCSKIGYQKPTISQNIFPNTPKQSFWTSYSDSDDFAISVGFYGGSSNNLYKTSFHNVRLVRTVKPSDKKNDGLVLKSQKIDTAKKSIDESVKNIVDKKIKLQNCTGASCTVIGEKHENNKNYSLAAKYYKKGCNNGKGSYASCMQLGYLYYSGKGFAKSEVSAYKYFQYGCDLGFLKGCILIEEYKKL